MNRAQSKNTLAPRSGQEKRQSVENSVEQAKTGYANAQDIIKFIDTKTGFVSGACMAGLAFTLQLVVGYFELPSEVSEKLTTQFAQHDVCFALMKALAAGSLLFGGVCLVFCTASLVGRSPVKNRPTILFPFFNGSASEEKYCKSIGLGMSERAVAEEYEVQVWNVGIILQRKLIRHRSAAWMLFMQVIFLCIAGIIFLLCVEI